MKRNYTALGQTISPRLRTRSWWRTAHIVSARKVRKNASERKAIGLDEKVVGNFIFLKYQWAKQDFERPPRWKLQPNQLFSTAAYWLSWSESYALPKVYNQTSTEHHCKRKTLKPTFHDNKNRLSQSRESAWMQDACRLCEFLPAIMFSSIKEQLNNISTKDDNNSYKKETIFCRVD